MSKEETKLTIEFGSKDFYNYYEEKNFFERLELSENKEEFIKQAAIHRAMIENQGEKNNYQKLMGYIQSKGMDYIIDRIEGKKEGLDEERVRMIVQEMIRGLETAPAKRETNLFGSRNEEAQVISESRKKASNKIMKL